MRHASGGTCCATLSCNLAAKIPLPARGRKLSLKTLNDPFPPPTLRVVCLLLCTRNHKRKCTVGIFIGRWPWHQSAARTNPVSAKPNAAFGFFFANAIPRPTQTPAKKTLDLPWYGRAAVYGASLSAIELAGCWFDRRSRSCLALAEKKDDAAVVKGSDESGHDAPILFQNRRKNRSIFWTSRLGSSSMSSV